jgi:hypothetical protein
MFITKHLLALVALAVGAASSCYEREGDECSKKLFDGKCGALSQEAKGKWDDYLIEERINFGIYDVCVSDVCCALNEADCCEANVGAIVALVEALVVVIALIAYWKYRQDDGLYGVAVPPGPLGVQFTGTCTVHAVTPRSPLRGVTKEGETLLAVNGKLVTPNTMLDATEAADDGTSERELVFRRSSKPLFTAGLAFRCVGVPPGPLGLQFHKGSSTVHAANPRLGVKEGETLLSVNGKPVRAATMLDEIKGADDGTSERMLVFQRASSSKPLLAAGETENGPPIVSKENAV